MKFHRIIGDRHTYWNIKGCAMLRVFLQASSSLSEGGMWRLLADKWHKCATASSSTFLDT